MSSTAGFRKSPQTHKLGISFPSARSLSLTVPGLLPHTRTTGRRFGNARAPFCVRSCLSLKLGSSGWSNDIMSPDKITLGRLILGPLLIRSYACRHMQQFVSRSGTKLSPPILAPGWLNGTESSWAAPSLQGRRKDMAITTPSSLCLPCQVGQGQLSS
jgi:hypothetical protein